MLPIIDVRRPSDRSSCRELTQALSKYGACYVRHTSVQHKHLNAKFLSMMSRYFAQSDGVSDARPDTGFQVGVTPPGKEFARDHSKYIQENLSPSQQPMSVDVDVRADPKWRFFWRIGTRNPSTLFPETYAEPVVPADFPQWEQTMQEWGSVLQATLVVVSAMIERGMDLPPTTLTSLLDHAPHLLAPTGYKGTDTPAAVAKFHYDFNLLTIHGRATHSGLYIWTRDGQRLAAKTPAGCFLVQAGMQLEYLTGGAIRAGFHEVVVNPTTLPPGAWRVSSPFFGHVQSDQLLAPVQYPPMVAGDFVARELSELGLQGERPSSRL